MKIYDCFNFFNELDILEIRLNELYEYVDYFIIVESNVTHSGHEKPFYFELNKHRYSKFLDKIISYKVFDTPSDFVNLPNTNDVEINKIYDFIRTQKNRFNIKTQPDYGRDFFQKESVRRALINCSDDDVILISDADEIPSSEFMEKIHEFDLTTSILSLNQPMYCYYVNVLKEVNWFGTKVMKYKNLKNLSLNEIRGDELLSVKTQKFGWHFSFMGGEDMVKRKLLSYSARDLVNNHILENISTNIKNNIDPFFRNHLIKMETDEYLPNYLKQNKEKYKHLFK